MNIKSIFTLGIMAAVALFACVGLVAAGESGTFAVQDLLSAYTHDMGLGLMGIGMVFSEDTRIGDFLKREWEALFNRETVTIASGQNLKAGTVVGKVTATGKYIAYDDGATDGSETAAGIVLFDVDASAADAKGVILARGPAVIAKEAVVFGAGVTTQGEKDNAFADLKALNIIARSAIGATA